MMTCPVITVLLFAGEISTDFVCEPDEYAQLVEELKRSGIIKDHRSGLTTYKSSFSGKDFVTWAVKTKGFGKITTESSRMGLEVKCTI